MSSYMESAASAMETRSSMRGMGHMSESTSYEAAITGGADSSVESRTTRIALGNDAGKPVFIETIEGRSVERKCAT